MTYSTIPDSFNTLVCKKFFFLFFTNISLILIASGLLILIITSNFFYHVNFSYKTKFILRTYSFNYSAINFELTGISSLSAPISQFLFWTRYKLDHSFDDNPKSLSSWSRCELLSNVSRARFLKVGCLTPKYILSNTTLKKLTKIKKNFLGEGEN